MQDEYLNELSKESIRSRMIKNAARIWGVEGEDIESTFDPLVAMLIEACAFELYKVNNEILDSQTRILERLARLLSPDAYTVAKPSYAIAHARSSDPESILFKETQFYAQKKILNEEQKDVVKDIYFSPAMQMKIFDGDMKYMAAGKTIYEYKNAFSKVPLGEERSGASLPHQHVYIALELNPKIKSIDRLPVYFDWKNDPEKDYYLSLIPLIKWYVGDAEITAVAGINSSKELLDKFTLSDHYNVSYRIENMVNGIFEKNFVTLSLNNQLAEMQLEIPEELKRVFSESMLSKLGSKCVWLKMVFPGAMKPAALNDLYLSMNTFPVINRKVNKITYQLRSNLNIAPLKTDDLFFDMINVQNSDGYYFKSNPLESGFNNEAGYYTLRSGGIERFDRRQATEFLNSTINLLRDENAAFSSMGKDFINTHINQINQAIAMIENRLSTKGERTRPSHFIILNQQKPNENVFIKFWSTNGAAGNLVKAGVRLTLASGSSVLPESAILMTTSTGGKMPMDEGEKITAFKRSILTHDRIVTRQDIEMFCYHEIGNMIGKIEIKKGWKASMHHKQSFLRILEILITPKNKQHISEQEWQSLATELQHKIESTSNGLMPVQVKFLLS